MTYSSQIHSPYSRLWIGLSYRPVSLCSLRGQYGNPMPPSQGLRSGPLDKYSNILNFIILPHKAVIKNFEKADRKRTLKRLKISVSEGFLLTEGASRG
jgi:hypothetical protein